MTKLKMQTRQSIRKHIREKRQVLSSRQQVKYAESLCEQLITLTVNKQIKTAAVYLANDGEISLEPYIHWCWKNKIAVYLPVVHPFSAGHLLFLRYQSDTLMKANSYGILEPALSIDKLLPIKQLQMIITPLVAFDEQGNRLGMGGGYYDRTLANVAAICHVLGVAHDIQKVPLLPIKAWDIPLKHIITPNQHYIFDK